MKQVLLVVAVVMAMFSMLCVGLALGIVLTPARAAIGERIARVLNRVEVNLRDEPRVIVRSERVEAVQPDAKVGILIAGVLSGSPAEQAGLRRGDILLAVDGKAVNQFAELQAQLKNHQPGDEVQLRVQRGDEEVTLTAALAEAPGVAPAAGEPAAYLGILPCGGQALLRPDIYQFRADQGVRILAVLPDSPAEQAGLKAGMLITAIDGQSLDRQNGLAQALAEHKPGDQVALTVSRPNGEEREVNVTLGEDPNRAGAAWLGVRYGPVVQIQPRWEMPQPEDGGPVLPNIPGHPFDLLPGDDPLDPENLPNGALIREVNAGSPAEEAGLKAGQVIQAVDGKEIDEQNALPDIIAGHQPGDTVTLTIFDPGQEGEKTRPVEVTLGERPDQPGAAWLGISFVYFNLELPESPDLPEG